MGEFRMPSLGADMDEGTLVEWLVAPGDRVERGQLVAVVDTDKSTIEVEVFEAGTVAELLAEPGATVPVGAPLARITAAGEEDAVPAPAAPEPSRHHRTRSPLVRHLVEEADASLDDVPASGPGGTITRADAERWAEARTSEVRPGPDRRPAPPAPRAGVRSSPLARRLAAERGADLTGLAGRGRGPGGAVVAADVPEPDQRPEGAVRPEPTPEDRLAATRRATAAVLARSKREIPHYYLSTTIDLAAASAWLAERNEGRPPEERTLMAGLFLAATVRAAGKVAELNGHWLDDRFVPAERVHLGVAVSLRGGGLVAPALLDADRLDLDGLMAALSDLVERARRGRLHRRELAEGTITVSNLGERGVEALYGVIQPPQVALVGFGRVVERPVAVDGELAVHPTVTATLSGDHRASDGHLGSRLLARIDRLLQDPEGLAGPAVAPEGGTP